ncbi:MAG: hypothetical protein WCO06_04625 [Candidatus Roizmanbacteria bacterium]
MEQIFITLEGLLFTTIIFMNLVRKNRYQVVLYFIQSMALVGLLFSEGIERNSLELKAVAVLVCALKVVFAPYFFYRSAKNSRLNLMTTTYLNIPMTLSAIVLIIFFCNSTIFEPLQVFSIYGPKISTMLFSSIFLSIFILINRKGALSQIIGILSVENSIVALGFFMGLNQTLAIEVGILFDVLVWIVLAIFFIEIIYKHLGSVNVTDLNKLKK